MQVQQGVGAAQVSARLGAVASTTVTVSILVMVVLGGVGTRWGAVLGAFVYVYLQQYLLKVAAEPSFAGLPALVRVPLSQPDVLLGALFIVFVLFAPAGSPDWPRGSGRDGNRVVEPEHPDPERPG